MEFPPWAHMALGGAILNGSCDNEWDHAIFVLKQKLTESFIYGVTTLLIFWTYQNNETRVSSFVTWYRNDL